MLLNIETDMKSPCISVSLTKKTGRDRYCHSIGLFIPLNYETLHAPVPYFTPVQTIFNNQ